MPTPALYINEFLSGLYTQRSPLVTPTSSQGLSTVVRTDVLAGGSNMELSNFATLVRRPGNTRYCSVAFGVSDYALNYHSFRNIAGTINLLADSKTAVSVFTNAALTSIFTKSTTAQSFFQTVGDYVYWCDGTSFMKYNGSVVSPVGVAAPVSAPTLSFGAGSLSPKSGYKYVFVYRTVTTISTASPVSASTLALTNQNITVQGQGSALAAITNIDIYRNTDGGSSYYFLATIANPGNVTWTYTDSTPDSGLNNFIVAPLNHANDAPPSGVNNLVYHMGRLWASSGRFVYFAGGPDTLNGSPEESWPPANVFSYPGKVTALVSTTAGLLVFTNGDSHIVRGTDSGSFYSQPWQMNFGVPSQNCVAQDGDLLYLYTSRRQLFAISSTLEEIGFPIGDQLRAGFDPTASYLALHRSGDDSGLFISDGSSNYFRYLITKDSWSTKATVSGFFRYIKSIAVTDSDYRLFGSRPVGGSFILFRDVANWQDDGSTYTCSANIGQLVIAPLGETVALEAISVERMPVGSAASVGIMAQEINTSFTNLPNPVNDPPIGIISTSILTQRHYLKAAATPVVQKMRHLQAQVSFPAENFKNELLGFALLKP